MKTRSRWADVRHALLGLCLAACGGAVGASSIGGESHFLRHCGDGCGSGLDCIADICTRSCIVAQDSCSDLANGATCTAASIEPGAIAVCDASCSSDAACQALGSDFTCQTGFCREGLPNVPGGSAGGPSVSGGSGGASSGGTTPEPSAGAPVAAGGEATLPDWSPPSRCLQPFDTGPCDAAIAMFAFADGRCVPVSYGGCEGNDNRFYTVEECISVCEGAPSVNACPEGRVRQSICIGCGPSGGCGETLDACALPCDGKEDCMGGPLFNCGEGFCQTVGCY